MPSRSEPNRAPKIPFEPPTVTTMRKVTRNFTGNEGSMPPTTSAASAPPRPASPLPTAKEIAKMRSTSTPRPRATRASSTAALNWAPNRVLTRNVCRPAAMIPQTTMMNSRGLVSDGGGGARHPHQDEADGEQPLIGRTGAKEPPIERALERHAED